MDTKRLITGVQAAAQAVRLADVDVIAAYPIRPYTGLMSELARMVADGELDAEFILAEGEHAQFSIAYGAAAAGARTQIGTSGVGLTFGQEVLSPTSGERLPVQCMIADRTLDPPGDFGSEHTEALTARDQAWLMGWAETPQEALDLSLLFYRIGEDPRVSLPQFPCQDGYFVSHLLGEVDVPDQKQVDEFLPPFKPTHYLDPQHPMIIGPQIEPKMGPPLQYQRHLAVEGARRVIVEATEQFNQIFSRSYAPLVETFMVDDAEVVFVLQGAHAWTARMVVQRLRSHGYRIGLAKLRIIRPWPTEILRDALRDVKVVGVIDNDVSFGTAGGSGSLFPEIRTSLYGLGDKVKTIGFTAGLGGEVITREEFYRMARKMFDTARTGRVEQDAYWIPFEL
jgi:pyruvate ferredoxin oxidoreductase alpha subunit/oxalate oxidoreductase subunit alpha